MLRSAPKFYEVAKRIVEITEDCILVAHNAQFDYRILTTEFRRLGFDFEGDYTQAGYAVKIYTYYKN